MKLSAHVQPLRRRSYVYYILDRNRGATDWGSFGETNERTNERTNATRSILTARTQYTWYGTVGCVRKLAISVECSSVGSFDCPRSRSDSERRRTRSKQSIDNDFHCTVY